MGPATWLLSPRRTRRCEPLKRVQVSQQLLNILLVKRLAIPRHLFATEPNNVDHPFVIGGEPAYRKIRLLENALQAGTFFSARGVRFVAAITMRIVNLAPRGLLRIEPKFPVRLAAFDITCAESHEREKSKARHQNSATR